MTEELSTPDLLPLLEQMRRAELTWEGQQGIPARTYSDLEWRSWTAALAEYCSGPETARHVSSMGVLPPGEALETRRALISDLLRICRDDERLPLGGLRDLEEVTRMAARQDTLQPSQFYDVLCVLDCVVDTKRSLSRLARADSPLRILGGQLDSIEQLRQLIDRSVDRKGELKDEASPTLGALRKKAGQLRRSILARLDAIVKSPKFEGILQDDFITLRDDRYVLPVRSGERGDFPGIVHGQSGSGATLFIEPQELVDSNNQHRLALLDVVNEERRILRELTAKLSGSLEQLNINRLVMLTLDLSQAAAAMAIELDLHPIELLDPASDEAHIELLQARHPLLVLKEQATADTERPFKVIANDLIVGGGARGLVISGPNTGGKTVSLKTIGFFALLGRAGLPAPAERGMKLPLFEHIFSDIGDEQGLEQDLSTFSAHVANVASFLPKCDSGALVLLDELFAGTDPEQGSALARALLSHLSERRSFHVTTTHLESLKTMAFEDPDFVCASVGFDLKRLAPSYKLRNGVPGASYALKIAERIGLSPVLVRKAANLLDDRFTIDREMLIAKMDAEHRALEDERRATAAERKRLEDETRKARETTARLRAREESALAAEEKRLRDEVRRLERLVKDQIKVISQLQAPKSTAEAESARELIDEARAIAREAAERAMERQRIEREVATGLDYDTLKIGQRVQVASFGKPGVITALAGPDEKVSVQIGALRARFDLSELSRIAEGRPQAKPKPRREQRQHLTTDDDPSAPILAPARSDEDATIDLRGARVDDALEHLQAALERGVELDLASMLVIHGHGTGALKAAVRRDLSASAHIRRWRPGEREEGGDGVTVAALRLRS